MTIVNIIAGLVYSKTKSFKDNKALITISAVFLVLLYNSPAALVLYWLFNNIFSLVKNICLKFYSHKDFIKYVFICSLVVYFIYTSYYGMRNTIIIVVLTAVIISNTDKFKSLKWDFDYKSLFLYSALAFWVLLGLFIPSSVISTSPLEFLFEDSGPVGILNYAAIVYAGLFLFWGTWIYYFANTKVKKFLSVSLCLLFIFSVLNFLTIKLPLAILSNTFVLTTLSLNEYSTVGVQIKGYWIIMLYFMSSFIWLVYKGYFKLIEKLLLILIITCCLLSVNNYLYTANKYFKYKSEMAKVLENDDKPIKLSKTDKNVLIIFLDSAINSYLPLIFEEYPKLYNQFRDFVYYPYTLSYARYTTMGYPPILGGYEYTPFRMDEREGKFEEKFNQAHALLPAIFSQNNWESTIINPVDKEWNLQTGIELKKYADIIKDNKYYNKFSIKTKKVPNSIINDIKKQIELFDSSVSKRNLIYFSATAVLPASKRVYVYDMGNYHNLLSNFENRYDELFLKNYCELLYMSKLTDFSQNKNTFTLFNNNLTHDGMFLNYPNYDILGEKDVNYKPPIPKKDKHSIEVYNVNVAALRNIGNYLDFLRKMNVYDNTRIIIVADHGCGGLYNPNVSATLSEIYLPYNPLLLVKDFNEHHKFKFSLDLMTNADIPNIATRGIIKNPTNLFTNKPITNKDKNEPLLIKYDKIWNPKYYLGKRKILNNNSEFLYIKGTPVTHKDWIQIVDYQTALDIFNKANGKNK